MGRLTTHVLDTANGRPGAGILIELFRAGSGDPCIGQTITNDDGRCDTPLLQGPEFTAGEYELVFHAGAYFEQQGAAGARPAFLDRVVVRFLVDDPGEHYHVPLLLSPYGYSTYRGS